MSPVESKLRQVHRSTVGRCRRFRDHAELSLISYPAEILLVATLIVVAMPMAVLGKATELSVLLIFPVWFQRVWAVAALVLSTVWVFAMHTRRSLVVASGNALCGTLFAAYLFGLFPAVMADPAKWWWPFTWYATIVGVCWCRASLLVRQVCPGSKIAGVKTDDG